jgi:hypothetical protein
MLAMASWQSFPAWLRRLARIGDGMKIPVALMRSQVRDGLAKRDTILRSRPRYNGDGGVDATGRLRSVGDLNLLRRAD